MKTLFSNILDALSNKFAKRDDNYLLALTGANASVLSQWMGEGCEEGVSLIAWLDQDGSVIEQDVYCSRNITEAERQNYRHVSAYSCIKIYGYEFDGKNRINCQRIEKRNPTPEEFKATIRNHQQPIVKTHHKFGEFKFNKKYDYYKTELKIKDELIELSLICESPEDYEKVLPHAESIFDQLNQFSNDAKSLAASELLQLANTEWKEHESAPDLTSQKFKSRMRLDSLSVYYDGSFELWYNADNMFTDHGILASGDLAQGITSADVA